MDFQWDCEANEPKWWRTFVQNIMENSDQYGTTESIESELADWGITYHEPERCQVSGAVISATRISFASERHYTVFLLKWA